MERQMNISTTKEIINVLQKFQEGYTKRDVNLIDDFMDGLFDKKSSITIVGTGAGEWCMGYEEAKELFVWDWQYWDDLRLNIEGASISVSGDTAWVYTNGSLKYSFIRNNDAFTRYLGYVRDFFAEDSEYKNSPNKVRLTEINWMLCHLLHQRDKAEAKYLWDIGVSYILVRNNDKWAIRQMTFSMPVVTHFPDLRIVKGNWSEGAYKEESDKVKSWSLKDTSSLGKEIREILSNFIKDYLYKNKTVDSITSNFFSTNFPFVINTDMQSFKGISNINKLISFHRSTWNEMLLNSYEAVVDCSGNTAWLAANGVIEQVINEEDIFDMAADAVKGIFNSEVSDKEKLFRIRRTIAGALKESAVGEEYVWPFRLEAVLTNKDEKWLFEYIQFSYPFSSILEGKTDAAAVEE